MSSGLRMKTMLEPDGLLRSQATAPGYSSRASTEDGDRPSVVGLDHDDGPGSQASVWHNNDVSSPRSALSKPSASENNGQLPASQALQEQDSSDIQEDLVGSQEIVFSDGLDEETEDSPKSFGEEEYTPSLKLTSTCSQVPKKLQRRISTHRKNPVRARNIHISKNRVHLVEKEGNRGQDIEQGTQADKSNSARGKSQKSAPPRPAGTRSFEYSPNVSPGIQMKQREVDQDTRPLPFKRRIAKKPFELGDKESWRSPAGPSYKRPNPRKKLSSAAKSTQTRNAAKRSGSDAEKSQKGKPAFAGTQKEPSDDYMDDDRPTVVVGASITKPNSKKRRSSPQGYGSRSTKLNGLMTDFPDKDGRGAPAHVGSKDNKNSKQGSQVPLIDISSDPPSIYELDEDLQQPPRKKTKTGATSSYKVQLTSPSQIIDTSNPGSDDSAGGHDGIVVQQKQPLARKGGNTVSNTSIQSISKSEDMVSSDPFTGPYNSENQGILTRVASQNTALGSPPWEASETAVVQPNLHNSDDVAVNNSNPWDIQSTAPRPKQKLASCPQPTSVQETYQYHANPQEPRRQQHRSDSFVRDTQARHPQPRPGQYLPSRCNAKTQEYGRMFAPLQTFRRENLKGQISTVSMPPRGDSPGSNDAPAGPMPPGIPTQAGYQSKQDHHIHEDNADDLQARHSKGSQRTRSGNLVEEASQGIATMLHEIVETIHRQLAPKGELVDSVVQEYDCASKKITATLLKRQQDEFKPTASKFLEKFQDVSKTVARSAQGIDEGTKAAMRKVEAFAKTHQKRKRHMREVQQAIRGIPASSFRG
ncbi:uncharacterized protein PG998_001763 [Apiospora kogelbergensis]|uniref:uncharacterized protein n=1 Tax=Apiospora kogelbergensis TaxID=1337665 RepID=UPI003131A68C